MRIIELRRHTDNDGDHLTTRGLADADEIGRTGLTPPYAVLVSTGAERTAEMLAVLRRHAGQEDLPVVPETGLRSAVEDRWREAAKAAGKGATVEDIRRVDPELVERETALLGGVLRRLLQSVPEGGRALVVGHSPTTEAAVLGLTGEVIAPLGKGEGVQVVEDGGRLRVSPLASGEPG